MTELKGSMFSMIIFIGAIIPFLLMIGIDSLHQHAFMKITTEVSELIKEEGGVTSKVKNIINNLNEKGYEITVKNQHGANVTTKAQYGDVLIIEYSYTYKSVRNNRTLNTTNTVFVMQRS